MCKVAADSDPVHRSFWTLTEPSPLLGLKNLHERFTHASREDGWPALAGGFVKLRILEFKGTVLSIS